MVQSIETKTDKYLKIKVRIQFSTTYNSMCSQESEMIDCELENQLMSQLLT